jgi:hypothetical protein
LIEDILLPFAGKVAWIKIEEHHKSNMVIEEKIQGFAN